MDNRKTSLKIAKNWQFHGRPADEARGEPCGVLCSEQPSTERQSACGEDVGRVLNNCGNVQYVLDIVEVWFTDTIYCA